MMELMQRRGISPSRRCLREPTCPDIIEMKDGDFLVIGRIAPAEMEDQLPKVGASLGPDEQMVLVPGIVMRSAAADLFGAPTVADLLKLALQQASLAVASTLRDWLESFRRLFVSWVPAPLFA
jgi:hypothetical protein